MFIFCLPVSILALLAVHLDTMGEPQDKIEVYIKRGLMSFFTLMFILSLCSMFGFM